MVLQHLSFIKTYLSLHKVIKGIGHPKIKKIGHTFLTFMSHNIYDFVSSVDLWQRSGIFSFSPTSLPVN